MIAVHTFKNKHVALFGLGGSGVATALALIAGGAIVHAWDDNEAGRKKAEEQGIQIDDLNKADWGQFSALILAPGVPLTHPEPHWVVKKAKKAKVEIIGDLELFARERAATKPNSPFIAITGTNGKSTTTALIAHLLKVAGKDVQMGGNIGVPVLQLEPPAEDKIHLLEISTFQIDLAPSLKPSVGILLNLTPDHIDRHGDFANYASIKERLVKASDMAVIGHDDEHCRMIAMRRQEKNLPMVAISAQTRLEQGIFAADSAVLLARGDRVLKIADIGGIGSLRGKHNAQNVAAAIAAVSLQGVDAATIQAGLNSFPGLEHRMEEIGHLGRTLFINDSKATNADSTDKALSAFQSGIFWIVGGKAKEGGIDSLLPYFSHVEKAYLIGDAMEEFAKTLNGKIPFERSQTLEMAVEHAAIDAVGSDASQPVVLLSPACASYDQFANFEMRGKRFRELCQGLPGFETLLTRTRS
jgi:UDP-N-acetylmuramoylalanine--D-glutamate ligase